MGRRVLIAVLASASFAAAAFAPSAGAAITFDLPVNSPIDPPGTLDGAHIGVENAEVLDANGDGDLDLVMTGNGAAVAEDGTRSIVVMEGAPGGGFDSTVRYSNLSFGIPGDIAVGDFNQDGDPDFAVSQNNHFSTEERDNSILIFLGGAGATFSGPTFIEAGTFGHPDAVASADLNEDGDLDLAVHDNASGQIFVLLGGPGASFGSPVGFEVAADLLPTMITGDFDGDGHIDLATHGASAQVLPGAGDGTFAPAVAVDQDTTVRPLISADFNGDGDPDLAGIVGGAALGDVDEVAVFEGGPGFEFADPVFYPAPTAGAFRLAAADLDADGDPELGLTASDTNYLYVMRGEVGATFGPAAHPDGRFPIRENWPWALVTGDFDGDADDDFAAVFNNDVSTVLNTTNLGLPETFIDSGPPRITNDPRPRFTFHADKEATFECSIDTGTPSFAPCSSGDSFGPLDDHLDYKFRVRARIDAGVDPTPDTFTFTLETTGAGVATFGGPAQYAAGGAPRGVALADLDGDGDTDVVTANRGSNDVSVLLGAGSGTLEPETRFAAGNHPFSLALEDLDGNGTPDVVVANRDSDDISVLLGTGDGSLGPATAFPVGDGPESVDVADLNEDGHLDVVVVNGCGMHPLASVCDPDEGRLAVLLGNGDGSFADPVGHDPGSGFALRAVTVGDMNGDGHQDLLTAGFGTVVVMTGTGDGTFSSGSVATYASEFGGDVDVADLDGDGDLDAVVSSTAFFNGGSHDTAVLMGNGNGGFDSIETYKNFAFWSEVAIGNLTGGEKPDLALAEGRRAIVTRGQGDGRFARRDVFGEPGNDFASSDPYEDLQGMAIGDVTGDGRNDIVVTAPYRDELLVFVNSTEDAESPETTIDAGPSGVTAENQPVFEFSSNEVAAFECRIDGAPFRPCRSGSAFGPDGQIGDPAPGSILANGEHVFEVRAADLTGNVDPTPASRAFEVQSDLPGDCGLTGATVSCHYFTTGAEQQFTVPIGVDEITVVARGEAGGQSAIRGNPRDSGGPGGVAAADLDVDSGEILYLEVAGVPGADESGGIAGQGASNGIQGGDGGGATSVRTCSIAAASCPGGGTSFSHRLFVAGGGGGGSGGSDGVDEQNIGGGAGDAPPIPVPGGLAAPGSGGQGGDIGKGGEGGAADAPGAAGAGTVPGESGVGANGGGTGTAGESGGAGGGGYFGGGGGGGGFPSRSGAGAGGGGSSFGPEGTTFGTTSVRASVSITYIAPDITPPETTIDSGPSSPSSDPTPTFEFSSNESDSAFECSLDQGTPDWSACDLQFTSTELADGDWTFRVRATDEAGNTDPTPAERELTVDTTAPDTTIEMGPSGETSDRTPVFTFSASEAGSRYECSLDQGTPEWSPCDSPFTAPELADGDWTFRVRATDEAGNTDPTPAERPFSLDTPSLAPGSEGPPEPEPEPKPELEPEPKPAPGSAPTCRGQAATIVAEPGTPTIGTDGDDVIVGTPGADEIFAGAGNDLVCSKGGDDLVQGGAGDDEIAGGAGNDTVFANAGTDIVFGNTGNDELHGGRGPDELAGGAGTDEVHGQRGPDLVRGGEGDDDIRGHRGPDLVFGGSGDDELDAGHGDDLLNGGAGTDACEGGPGENTFSSCG